jgi:hypothetical protein
MWRIRFITAGIFLTHVVNLARMHAIVGHFVPMSATCRRNDRSRLATAPLLPGLAPVQLVVDGPLAGSPARMKRAYNYDS